MTDMSPMIDQVKHHLAQTMSKWYKDFKGKVSPEEWKEFEVLFWKIRPLVTIDYSKYEPSIRIHEPEVDPLPETSVPVLDAPDSNTE